MVWINVDETSIQFGYNKKKGTVLNGSSWPDVETTVSTTNMHEWFSLSDVRARVSYIAAAANDLEVQRVGFGNWILVLQTRHLAFRFEGPSLGFSVGG